MVPRTPDGVRSVCSSHQLFEELLGKRLDLLASLAEAATFQRDVAEFTAGCPTVETSVKPTREARGELGDVVLVISCVNACGFEPDALFFAFALPEGTHVGMYVC